MNRFVLSSPAKLNFYLKVQNKRPDGYHNIITVFERIDLADVISFRDTSDGKIRIHCAHPHVPTGRKNLVYRAAQLLQKECGVKRGVKITIDKRIPVAAGLAGGSSNAATALLGLNRLWKLRLAKPKLIAFAKKIGSDVAFFLYDASWGVGRERGDLVKKLQICPKFWHILVVPRVKIYSADVYGALKLQLTKKDDNVKLLIHNLKKGNILEACRQMENDLETEIIRRFSRLKDLKESLKSLGAKGVLISGSGPSVFGVVANKRKAESIRSVLSKRFSQTFIAKTL